jgi:putative ABC transport system permease protein
MEITRLLSMVGVGTRVLQGMGVVLLLVAALSVFIALWSAVRERRADIAMLRMLGAPPWKVGALLLCEALWLALLASALGLLAAQGLTALLGWLWMADQGLDLGGWHWPPALSVVPLAAIGVALAAAAVPAISAYRVDVTSLLQTR